MILSLAASTFAIPSVQAPISLYASVWITSCWFCWSYVIDGPSITPT